MPAKTNRDQKRAPAVISARHPFGGTSAGRVCFVGGIGRIARGAPTSRKGGAGYRKDSPRRFAMGLSFDELQKCGLKFFSFHFIASSSIIYYLEGIVNIKS